MIGAHALVCYHVSDLCIMLTMTWKALEVIVFWVLFFIFVSEIKDHVVNAQTGEEGSCHMRVVW